MGQLQVQNLRSTTEVYGKPPPPPNDLLKLLCSTKVFVSLVRAKWVALSHHTPPIMLLLVLGQAGQPQSTVSCPTIPAAPVSASNHCPPYTARPRARVHAFGLCQILSCSLKTLPPDFPFSVIYLFCQRAPLSHSSSTQIPGLSHPNTWRLLHLSLPFHSHKQTFKDSLDDGRAAFLPAGGSALTTTPLREASSVESILLLNDLQWLLSACQTRFGLWLPFKVLSRLVPESRSGLDPYLLTGGNQFCLPNWSLDLRIYVYLLLSLTLWASLVA